MLTVDTRLAQGTADKQVNQIACRLPEILGRVPGFSSPSRNSSPSMKIEGSIPARNSSSRNTQTLSVQVLQRMVES